MELGAFPYIVRGLPKSFGASGKNLAGLCPASPLDPHPVTIIHAWSEPTVAAPGHGRHRSGTRPHVRPLHTHPRLSRCLCGVPTMCMCARTMARTPGAHPLTRTASLQPRTPRAWAEWGSHSRPCKRAWHGQPCERVWHGQPMCVVRRRTARTVRCSLRAAATLAQMALAVLVRELQLLQLLVRVCGLIARVRQRKLALLCIVRCELCIDAPT